MSIPVVDFGDYSLDKHDVTDERLQELSQTLGAAFTDFGFVFLKNTGITREEVKPQNQRYITVASSVKLTFVTCWSVVCVCVGGKCYGCGSEVLPAA